MFKISGEFKINDKWINGELLEIDIENHKYLIKILSFNKIIEHKNKYLIFHCPNIRDIMGNYSHKFKINEQVEFFDNILKIWFRGEIKNIQGDFYLINYMADANLYNSKIVHLNNIRLIPKEKETYKFDIDKCRKFSLESFQSLNNYKECQFKFCEQIKKIFNDLIEKIFISEDNLYIFEKIINENPLNYDMIKNMILIAKEHFEEMEKLKNTDLNLSNEKNKNQKKIFKEDIKIEKDIFEFQKHLIDSNVKIEEKKSNNQNEIILTLKSKDEMSLKNAISLLSVIQSYITIPINENDPFFTNQDYSNQKNIFYFSNLYNVNENHFPYDDNSTTIRVIGKKENVNYFRETLKEYGSSLERKNKKLNDLNELRKKMQTLN